MGRGKKAPQWGFPRRCCGPRTKALDSGHSGDFPGGATLSVSSQVNRRVARTSRSRAAPPVGEVTAPSLVFLRQREYIRTGCDRKKEKGTRSTSVKIGMGRQKQTIPPPSFLPPCFTGPPGDLAGPWRDPRELRSCTLRAPGRDRCQGPKEAPTSKRTTHVDSRKYDRTWEQGLFL